MAAGVELSGAADVGADVADPVALAGTEDALVAEAGELLPQPARDVATAARMSDPPVTAMKRRW